MNNSGPEKKNNVNIKDIWLDKAEVCVSMGLYQAARELLSEAHLASVVSYIFSKHRCIGSPYVNTSFNKCAGCNQELGEGRTQAKALLSQARLACAEHNFDQALNFLDKAQELGGDESFWYQLTLTLIKAVAGQRATDAHLQVIV